jgi:hypothetical protein
MKKLLSALLMCTLLIGCVFALASCGNSIKDGEYVAEDLPDEFDSLGIDEITLVVEDDQFIFEMDMSKMIGFKFILKLYFDYKIDDDEIDLEYDDMKVVTDDETMKEYFESNKEAFEAQFEELVDELEGDFEKTKNGFIIEDLEFERVKK